MIPKEDYVDEVINALFDDAVDPRISVVGVGGAGNNVVSAIYERDLHGIETVAVNTDVKGLGKTLADVKVLLSKDGESSASESIEDAEEAAEKARDHLRDALSSDIVFVIAGLGGSTGTGAGPVVTHIAKEMGAVVIGIALLPFEAENRSAIAQIGLTRLKEEADTMIVVDNNSLLQHAEHLSLKDGFTLINRVIVTVIEGVLDHLSKSFLTTLAEEVENVAREMEDETVNNVGLHVEAQHSVEASPQIQPVAFDASGFIGLR